MLYKDRILAISKSDMLDQELMDEIKETLPEGVQSIFISSVSGYNIQELKDLLSERYLAHVARLLRDRTTF